MTSGSHAVPLKRTAGTFEVQLFIRTVEFKRQPKPEPVVEKARFRQTGIAVAAVLAPIALAAIAVFVF